MTRQELMDDYVKLTMSLTPSLSIEEVAQYGLVQFLSRDSLPKKKFQVPEFIQLFQKLTEEYSFSSDIDDEGGRTLEYEVLKLAKKVFREQSIAMAIDINKKSNQKLEETNKLQLRANLIERNNLDDAEGKH